MHVILRPSLQKALQSPMDTYSYQQKTPQIFYRPAVTHTVPQLLKKLEQHPHPVIDLKLVRVLEFMKKIGHPERRIPPVLHIAGTNGKGSTVANLKSMLEAHGKTVHTYTSPHLVHFNERITIAGKPIDDALLTDVLQEVISASEDFPITWFESTTAAAFLAFSRIPADILLLETGLGGRLDATNIIDQPLLTAITPISMDHEQFLGSTIHQIATEKAGIIKQSRPCVVAKQSPEALQAIEQAARSLHAPLYRHAHEWHSTSQDGQLTYHSQTLQCNSITPALTGSHQLDNAAFAIACMDALAHTGFLTLSCDAIRHGLAHATWPARLQHLNQGILANLMPEGSNLWLDGGHNTGAAIVLADWLRSRPSKRTHIILGMMNGRDAAQFITPIIPYAASITTVTIPHQHDPQSAQQLADAITYTHKLTATTAPSISAAINHALAQATLNEDVLICGSLYLAGAVLAENAGINLQA